MKLKQILLESSRQYKVGNLTFVKPVRAVEDTPILVDVDKVEQYWRNDNMYLGPGGKGDSGIAGRYERFQEWLVKNPNSPIEMSEVYFSPQLEFSFIDGRHRFCVLRDKGVKQIYMCFSPDGMSMPERVKKKLQ